MISASPHQYRTEGTARGVSPEIIQRAVRQATIPERQKLPAVLTLRHLAHLTGADYGYLREVVSRNRPGYRTFVIQKRAGGARHIAVPEPTLRAVQRWIQGEILKHRHPHFASAAYARKCSPAKCATKHLGARWLIKVDIHDFFESLTERGAYFVFRECGYQPLVAFELARLCTRVSTGRWAETKAWQPDRKAKGAIVAYRHQTMGHLPQGAPTSPMLSNLISFVMDQKLQALADKCGLVYTRYSDDIIFSTGEEFSRKRSLALIANIRRIFEAFGLKLHRKKVTIAPPGARKIVLGFLVDGEQLRLLPELRHRISDHVRGVEKFGLAAHATHLHFGSLWGFVRHLEGLLAYAASVEPAFAEPLASRLKAALRDQGWQSEVEVS